LSKIYLCYFCKRFQTFNFMRNCLQCGKVLKGRTDKKFCQLSCRNAYHNNLQSRKNKHVKNTLRKLLHNRSVLLQILGNQPRVSIALSDLMELGFAPNYITQWHANRLLCFETVVEVLSEENVCISRVEDVSNASDTLT
jgi:DNA-binding transcriptional regulator of glucitol operon